MIKKKLKEWFGPTEEELKLADSIKKLFETHNVTIITNKWSGWRVSVEKKKETK